MAQTVPTLPNQDTQDKRLAIRPRVRLDATDWNNGFALLTQRVANWFRSMFWSTTDTSSFFAIRGFKVQQQASPNMSVRVTTEDPTDPDEYSAGLQQGYLCKDVSASSTLSIDTQSSGTRYDVIMVRYVEDDTDLAVKPVLTQPSTTQVIDEAPSVNGGNGDGTTSLYDLANSGVIHETLVATVNGVPVNAVVIPGTGGNGVDQIAFADAPTSGAPIRIDYYWRSGGEEKNSSIYTRFTSTVEYKVEKGTAGAGEPATPAGWAKLAVVGPITSGTTTITDSIIVKKRRFWYGEESTVYSTAGQSLGGFFDSLVFFVNGLNPVINMVAATVLDVKRTANGTDPERIMRWFRRGSSTSNPTSIDRDGHLLQSYKHFVEQWHHLSIGSADSNKIWDSSSSVETGGAALFTLESTEWGGVISFANDATPTANDAARLENWVAYDLTGTADDKKVVARFRVKGSTTSTQVVELGFWKSSAYVLLRSTNGGNWLAVVHNGSTEDTLTTGVAFKTTDWQTLEIHQRDASTWEFTVDGTRVVLTATPGSATAHRLHLSILTGDTTQKRMYVQKVEAANQLW